jgi:glycosyltransferase involved in cell wall biosynthesis
MKKKILIIGKTPPSVGGVTTHVTRLIENLKQSDIPFTFCDLHNGIIALLPFWLKHRVIHVHASNVYLRLFFAVLGKLSFRKLIQTYHGDLNRFSGLKNFYDLISVRYTKIPIVLNKNSYLIAKKKNKNSRLISAYINPVGSESLPDELKQDLNSWKMNFKTIFCTTASDFSYDKHGMEIYGGTELVTLFNKLPNMGLIFSDPSGKYKNEITKKFGTVGRNIYFIDFPHSFFEILKLSDFYLRATTTDGDSLSVREALACGTGVIASDCVRRPDNCILFSTADFKGLEQVILTINKNKKQKKIDTSELNLLLNLYNELLK